MFYLYTITNKITGRLYVGQTNNPNRRFACHRTSKACPALYNAIHKHGIENFEFKIIRHRKTEKEILKLESKYIKKLNSLSPNGYNLKIYDEPKFDYFTKEVTNKMSNISQGNNKNPNKKSRFIGIKITRSTFETRITKNRTIYFHSFKTELDAANAYDKMALYLYGDRATLNFEENRNKYNHKELKQFFNFFNIRKKFTSNYLGVGYHPESKKWRSSLHINSDKDISLGLYKKEKDAALAYDKFIIYFKIKKELNFPNKKSTYNKKELKEFCENNFHKTRPKSDISSVFYNNFYKIKNKWSPQIRIKSGKIIRLGYFKTKKRALMFRKEYIKNNPNILFINKRKTLTLKMLKKT